jgi:DNA-binding MarR family transcriptional regulator
LDEQDLLKRLAKIEQLMLRVGWLEQHRFAQDLSDFDLTVPQFFILRSVWAGKEGCSMSTLADGALRRSATMTGIVDRLVRMGLVTRQRDVRDRRRVLVELTPAGREVLGRVRKSREKRLRETLACLSPRDAEEFLRLLELYLQALHGQYDVSGAG